MSPRSARALAAALLVLAPLLLTWPFVAGEQTLYFRDIARHYIPELSFFQSSLSRGELPLWNPGLDLGYPSGALAQLELFYPPMWPCVLAMGSPERAFALWVLLHLILAGFGFFAWQYERTSSPPASLGGALAYQLGGVTLSATSLMPCLAPMAWMPWTCLAVEKMRRPQSPRSWPAALATFFALQILSGGPLLILQGALIVLLVWYAGGSPPGGKKKLLRLGFQAALLASVVLLPTLEAGRQSTRGQADDPGAVLQYSLAPPFLASWLLPPAVPDLSSPYWPANFPGLEQVYFPSLYLGPLALALLWIGVKGRQGPGRRWRRVLLCLASGSVLFSLGGNLPGARQVVELLGPLLWLRYPSKLAVLTSFLASALVVEGLLHFEGRRKREERPCPSLAAVRLQRTLWALACLGALGVLFELGLQWGLEDGSVGPAGQSAPSLWQRVSPLVHLSGLSTLAAVLTRLRLDRWARIPGGATVWALSLLLGLDLLVTNGPLLSPAPADFYAPRPLALSLEKKAPRTRVFDASPQVLLLRPGSGGTLAQATRHVQSLGGHIPVIYGLTAVSFSNVVELRSHPLLLRQIRNTSLERSIHVLGHLGVQYVVYDQAVRSPQLEEVRQSQGLHLYAVREPLPRTYLATEVAFVPDPLGRWSREIQRPGPDGTRRRLALLREQEGPVRHRVLEALGHGETSRRGERGACNIVDQGNHWVRVRIAPERPSLLVLLDQSYPGWRVTVDGERRELLEVNGFGRGVLVEPADRFAEFTYVPWSVLLGAGLSVLGVLLMLYRRTGSRSPG